MKTSPWIAKLRTALPALLILLLPTPALAWNAAGHRLVATIAWHHFDNEVRTEVARLLHAHPDYERWCKRIGDECDDKQVFIEASTWPDEIRKDPRFYNPGVDEPTPLLAGFPDMGRHRSWHYVNRSFEGASPEQPQSGQIDRQLIEQANILGTRQAPLADRSYALPWLIHMVGDAHQPLHASIRLDADGKWDKLGNGTMVHNPFNPRKLNSTLHAFWDDLPGPPGLRGERLDKAAQALIATYPHPARTLSSDQWITESWRIARDSAYPEGEESSPTISAVFFENSRQIANRRVSEAGCRLADLLSARLKNKKPRE